MKTNHSDYNKVKSTKTNIFATIFYSMIIAVLFLAGCDGPGRHQRNIALESMPVEMMEEEMEAVEVEEMADVPPSQRNNTEEYDRIYENPFRDALQNPLSTFSIDVDNASYSNIRRFLNDNSRVPKDAVRIEEMINYFSYNYPQPTGEHPFSIVTEIAQCPWKEENRLVHIGIQGKSINYNEQKPSNLVFLIDASGSMDSPNKIDLLKKSFRLLLNELTPEDKVAIVTYAGSAGLKLPSTPASEKETIMRTLNRLQARGSTAGGQGIQLAYDVALKNLIEDGNNRVILATDGDFNIGMSSTSELVRLIEEKRKQDIFLTICGFGMGNYKDGRMEQISNAGNGNYFYIDNIHEAKKVFVTELKANMFTIAKDVKIQIEFNPQKVKGYRLIGYENRVLANEDFNDDKKDAGELGAGHTVTALYEIIPADAAEEIRKTDALKYQKSKLTSEAKGEELMTVKFRYKPMDSDQSKLIVRPMLDQQKAFEGSSENFRFSAAVAGFGLLLRDSQYKGALTYQEVLNMAQSSTGTDPEGYRAEFTTMVKTAELLYQ